MKRIFGSVIALSTLVLVSCGGGNKKDGFSLKGTLSNANGEMLRLIQLSPEGEVLLDSTKVDEKGNFEFENANKLKMMDFYKVQITPQNFTIIIADSSQQITAKGDAKALQNSFEVEGSPDTKQFIALNKFVQKIKGEQDSLAKALQKQLYALKMDSIKADSLDGVWTIEYDKIIRKYAPQVKKMINEYPVSIANFAGFDYIKIDEEFEFYKDLNTKLKAKYPNSILVNQLDKAVSGYAKQFELDQQLNKSLPNGKVMSDINLPTPEGKNLALSSLKGKVVLVDFWASWCGPCRQENPNVVKAYNQYHSKGFDVFSVSLDEDKEKWMKAIQDDKLKWNHVSDLKGFSSSVCSQFGIGAIPFTVLIDREGKIIAKNLRGSKLDEKLQEVFSK